MTDISDFTENSIENTENSNHSQDEIDLEGNTSQNDGTSDDVLDTVNTENDTELPSAVSEEPSEKILRLPISRIKKIMKMDPDVGIASQEAVFLITKATVSSVPSSWYKRLFDERVNAF